jgi:hypothetical protein
MVKVGCGSAYEDERLDWPLDLAKSGAVSYLGFDCLGERTSALAHTQHAIDESTGYNKRLPQIVDLFGPYISKGVKLVGNFGAANPERAAQVTLERLKAAGLEGVRVGLIRGDNVLKQVMDQNVELPELGCRVADSPDPVVAADAYSGAAEIVELLGEGAEFIIGGRTADSSLYVGPIVHEMKWDLSDWDHLALACAAGHLIECSTHVTGGNYLDPPYQDYDDVLRIGYPIAEVEGDDIVITKLPGSGGVVNERTVKLQLSYEIHDPTAYLTPDISADFSQATVEEIGPDRVRVTGITGRPRPETLKVLVALDLGWKASCEMSFGGIGCVGRGQLAADILRRRVEALGLEVVKLRTDLVGYDSLWGDAVAAACEPTEVRLRVAARCRTEEGGRAFLQEARHLIMATSAVTGWTPSSLDRFIGVTPTFLSRSDVPMSWELLTS